MQKIKVKVTYELEIPDDWKIIPPSDLDEKHLMIDGRFFLPDLMWMEYKGKNADGNEEWEGVDDEIFELINDHTICQADCSITRIKRFSFDKE